MLEQSETKGAASNEAVGTVPARSPVARLGLWLSADALVREAEIKAAQLPMPTRPWVARAIDARDAADRILHPVQPLRGRSEPALALLLYREAVHSALIARTGKVTETLAEAWDDAAEEQLAGAFESEADRSALRGLLLPAGKAISPADVPAARLAQIDALVGRLVDQVAALAEALPRARRQGVLRWALLICVSVAALMAGVSGLRAALRGPDIAAGKPWRASSAYGGFDPAKHVCDGTETNILFHTKEEVAPWYEVDLGAPQKISSVEIRNRSDGLQDRAVPLVVEVSTDHDHWTEVGRRNESFNFYRASFSAREARYVKVTAKRKTWLHLEQVAVRP